jgi:hypothetical protein
MLGVASWHRLRAERLVARARDRTGYDSDAQALNPSLLGDIRL